MSAPLSPETRTAALRELAAEPLDVLVVGAGITGAGIARDAALRGLRTALVDAVDFAAGTSSRSSKLIHGGLRYLEQGDVGLVREAATERTVLRRIAPHLAEPILLVLPTPRRSTHVKLAAGLFLYQKIAGVEEGDHHHVWGRAETLAAEPLLAPDLHGGVAFTEYLTDDARLVIANVLAAHAAGALVANHVEVTGIARERATLRDALDGTTFDVRARVVVNAGGPWVDELRRRADAHGPRRLQLTKGIHLVVPHARLPIRHGVVMAAADKRSVFALPRDGVTYIGTTDTFHPTPDRVPALTRADAEYLLEATNRVLRAGGLGLDDVIAAWSGLRPLLAEPGKPPSEISRKDEVLVDAASGLLSIAGGKLTAYRRMAERIVDLVCERLGRRAAPCRTDVLPLPGGEAPVPALPATLAPHTQSRLRRLYGSRCAPLLARDPAATELLGLPGVLRAEIVHAIDGEMALTLEDVLERRTRALLFDARQGLDGVDAVAAIMAERLGWNAARTADEIERYRRLASSLRSFA